ncbi:MAG: carbonic anhydrase [Gammaproteobacteria bacterium]|nr:carbonic anhydrase [Gammaproteobacteria bacterium]
MNDSDSPGQNAVEALLQGVRSFREREYGESGALMPNLSSGQQPGAMMIACADSRVDPALIFGARPGDLLVVRVVANLVPPPDTDSLDSGVMSAVELGLKTLGIPHLIVCGHSNCAGVRTALDEALHDVVPEDYCLHEWTTVAVPACEEVIAAHGELSADELARNAEQRSVLKSLENLRAHPWLQDLETSGKLTLHGWWFDIATGDLWIADPETGDFVSV